MWLKQAGEAADSPVLLAAGTKSHQKGFDLLVLAFVELLQQESKTELVILGLTEEVYCGQDQQKALRRKLRKHPQAQRQLHFPGRVGNMCNWCDKATLFVLPSRYEGFPNVFLEAMAAGCCCVAADSPHVSADLLRHDRDGVLISRQVGLGRRAESLAQLLGDPVRRQLLQAAAATVRELISEFNVEKQLVHALERLG